ncbi:MAG: hypothetical protein DWQ07_10175 [Chloroflexi bacterium]|nr:MAG: hypothetical protein DWQ07_10175 [Chloroflexota bacterium]MBL1192923.1 hypothetical protein [Chloroflexota bacterium]NOH10216.1 hypothetical protein [Chloroflexota bacterium]
MDEEKQVAQEQPEAAHDTPVSSTEEKVTGEPQQPSRFNRFLRVALRWAVGLGVVFALGIALTWFVQVQPRAERIQELKGELSSANQQITDLEAEISDLQTEVNELLVVRDERDRAEVHLSLLNVLVDVSYAQMALAQNDPTNALAALEDTDLKLINLRANVENSLYDTVDELRTRLTLVQEGIDSDTFAAQSDLDVMRNSLLALEAALFGE